jgi:MazG family protein
MDAALANTGQSFIRLVEIMAQLRAPGGCPWDREQTFESIKPYTLEETYEVLDAIDAQDWPGLAEELGDFILQAVFYAEMARERGLFSIEDSLRLVNEKLVRRHPHIFADGDAKTSGEVLQRWDEIKKTEKVAQGKAPAGMLDGVSRAQPALAEAQQISSKVAKKGFDWPGIDGVTAKIREEIAELEAAAVEQSPDEIEDELGDLLFSVVNLARFHKVDAEQALRRANAKFRGRFGYVERELGKPLEQATLDEMELRWQEAKRLEREPALRVKSEKVAG